MELSVKVNMMLFYTPALPVSEAEYSQSSTTIQIMQDLGHIISHSSLSLFPVGPLSPALVMEYLPFGNLLTFLRVSDFYLF